MPAARRVTWPRIVGSLVSWSSSIIAIAGGWARDERHRPVVAVSPSCAGRETVDGLAETFDIIDAFDRRRGRHWCPATPGVHRMEMSPLTWASKGLCVMA